MRYRLLGRSAEFRARDRSIFRLWPISLKKAAVVGSIGASADGAERLYRPLCGLEGLHRDQLGHLAKVLSGGCERELVARSVRAGIVEDGQILIDRSAGGFRGKSLVAFDPLLPVGIGLDQARIDCKSVPSNQPLPRRTRRWRSSIGGGLICVSGSWRQRAFGLNVPTPAPQRRDIRSDAVISAT